MNSIIRNVLAVTVGIVFGSIVNMGLITLSGLIIPPPEGVNPEDMESIKASIHLFEPKHFLFPYLAHSLGTLFGAALTGIIAIGNKRNYSLLIGLFFLAGGITATFMIPAPTWFVFLDLATAYIPMGFVGGIIAIKLSRK